MKLLVTGGTGFIGSHLAERARRTGAEVVVLGLVEREEERENARRLESLGVEVVAGSVTEEEPSRRAVRAVTHVEHLAVAMREAGVGDDYFERVNLDGTRQLLEAAQAAGVQRFVYCSTIGIFGHRFAGIANEDSPLAPGNVYERSKVAAEKLVREFGTRTGLPVVILRPGDVYGPRDRRLLKLFRGVARGRFPLIGDGAGRRPMVYVDDLVAAFERATERSEAIGRALIVAGPEVCTLRRLIEEILHASGRKRYGFRLPLAPALALAAVVEDVCKPLGLEPPLYRRRMDFYTSDAAFDVALAKSVLGWEPKVGLGEGVRRTLESYREAGLL